MWVWLLGTGVASLDSAPPTPEGTRVADRISGDIVLAQLPLSDADDVRRGEPDLEPRDSIPLGSRIILLDPANASSRVRNMTPDFAAAGRPDLSFDARRVLFIGKRTPADPFSVWEMKIDGSSVRSVTGGTGDCREAIYLSPIFTIDADEPVYQIAFRNSRHVGEVGSLYTCRMDGSQIRRISFAPFGASDPFLLSDGRLLFSLWSRTDQRFSGSAEAAADSTLRPPARANLFTIHTDGTDLFPFGGVHESPVVRTGQCETADGWVVYVESGSARNDGGARLAAVSRARSFHTRRVLADDPDGLYRSPSPLPDGKLLVSYRQSAGDSYGLYVFDPETGTRTRKLFDDTRWHDVDAVPVHPRPEPAGRSSVVDERTESGQLYCLNAYLSNPAANRGIEHRGKMRLRVIQHVGQVENLPATLSGFQPDLHHVLGEIPVEPDGSFFLEVPARVPLRLETLNADGDVLQSMHSWFWVMPNERRGCIGCHEDRELSPPNRHAAALGRPPRRVGRAGHHAATADTETAPRGAYPK
jgi:Tol biopolymer transport system component